jgi:hypothetical protein
MLCCARSECTVEGHAVVMHIVQACVVDHGLHCSAPVCACALNKKMEAEVKISWMNTWKVLHTVVLRHTPARVHSVQGTRKFLSKEKIPREVECARTRTVLKHGHVWAQIPVHN